MGARAVPFLHDGAGNVLCELDRRGTVWCRPALTRVLSDQEDNSVQSVVDLLRSIYSSDASDDRVANLQVAVARQIVRRCTGWDLNDEEPTLAPSSSSSSEQEDEEDHDDDDDPSIVLAEPLRRRPLPEPVAEPVDDDPEEIDGDAGGEDDASVGVSSDPAASQGPVPVSAPTCAYAVSRPLPPARRRSSMLYPDAKASVVAPPTGSRPAVSVWTPDTFPRRLSSGVRQEFSSFTLEAHGKKLSSSRVRCLERIQASIDGENAALVAIDLVALVACNAMLREMLDDAQTTLPDLPLPTRKSFGDSPRKRSSGGDRRSNGESPRSDRILLFRVLKVGLCAVAQRCTANDLGRSIASTKTRSV